MEELYPNRPEPLTVTQKMIKLPRLNLTQLNATPRQERTLRYPKVTSPNRTGRSGYRGKLA